MTHIITGHKGFVGSNLVEYFNQSGKQIQGFSRNPVDNELSYDSIHVSLQEAQSVIHLAGKAHDLKNASNEKDYFEVNTELTTKLFNQFLESDCEVFIYLSSVKAAADEVEGVLDETVIPNPITAYGKSKLAAENYLLSKEIPVNKRVYILRPCMIHGPNNKGNLNLLYSFVAKGIPYPFGEFLNQRSFVSVENLCFIIKELLDNPKIPSGIYNIADDDSLSTNELISIIGQVMQKPARIVNIPKPIIQTIAKIGDVLRLPINTERLQKLTENYVVSNQKIKKALQLERLPLSTKEGLAQTFKSFKSSK